jgi:transcriptional regulator with XRE-family HTH domain
VSELTESLRTRRLDTVGTVEALCDRADIDPTAVADIELGRLDRISHATFERYCEAIGLDVVLKETRE